MTDLELERLAAQLGEKPAEALDAERVAARVLARLEQEPVVSLNPAGRAIRWVGALAAAAALILAVRLAVAPDASEPSGSQVTVLQELDQLGADQLEEILQSMPVTVSALPLETVPLQELDSIRLERLLRSLEG
jgi:hypothetical protein